jgi:PadR family transcriptional regulator PadR
MHHDRRLRWGSRCRWRAGAGWEVRPRVERFIEPALLLLLRDGPRHGYELLEQVAGLVHDDRGVDLGNLYRVLRGLEVEGLVRSEWHAEIPGPAKRVYQLAPEGQVVLRAWADALARTAGEIEDFVERYRQGERR